MLHWKRPGDTTKIFDEAVSFNLIDSRESETAKSLFVEMMKISAEPFFPKNSASGFQFADRDYSRRSREIVKDFSQSLKYSPPPSKIIFLHRKLGGIFSLLQKLEVEISVAPYWSQIVDG